MRESGADLWKYSRVTRVRVLSAARRPRQGLGEGARYISVSTLGKVPQLRPEFLQGALAKVSPELLKDVAKPLVDQCCEELKPATATEIDVDRVCGALNTWLRCAGKKVAGAALVEHEAFQVPPLERPAGGDPQPRTNKITTSRRC